jgi:hypothetical protein
LSEFQQTADSSDVGAAEVENDIAHRMNAVVQERHLEIVSHCGSILAILTSSAYL